MDLPLEIDVSEAARLVKLSGYLLLDVRESDECAICRIEGSRHIPMGQVPARLAELPADQPVLVLCHHGGRSLRVTRFLRANHLPLACNVAGGIDAWAEIVDPGLARY